MELREKRACGGCSARVGKKKGGAKRRDKGYIEITNLTGFYSPVFPFSALVSRWFRDAYRGEEEDRGVHVVFCRRR